MSERAGRGAPPCEKPELVKRGLNVATEILNKATADTAESLDFVTFELERYKGKRQSLTLPPIAVMTANLLYWVASDPVLARTGHDWYNHANSLMGSWGVSARLGSGVVSALSANNRWARNLVDAENLISNFASGGRSLAFATRCCTFNGGKLRAIAILESDTYAVLKGPKQRAFSFCIERPERSDVVCVDGHAWHAAIGRERHPLHAAGKMTALQYATVAAAYFRAAHVLGLRPMVLQAAVWTVYRGSAV